MPRRLKYHQSVPRTPFIWPKLLASMLAGFAIGHVTADPQLLLIHRAKHNLQERFSASGWAQAKDNFQDVFPAAGWARAKYNLSDAISADWARAKYNLQERFSAPGWAQIKHNIRDAFSASYAREQRRLSDRASDEYADAEHGARESSVSSESKHMSKVQDSAIPFDIPELHDKERLGSIARSLRRHDAWERKYNESQKRLKQLEQQSKDGKWPDNLPKLKRRPPPAKCLSEYSEDEMQSEIEWEARSSFTWNRIYHGENRRVEELEREQRTGKMSAATQKIPAPSVWYEKDGALLSDAEIENEIEHKARQTFADDCIRRHAEANYKKRNGE